MAILLRIKKASKGLPLNIIGLLKVCSWWYPPPYELINLPKEKLLEAYAETSKVVTRLTLVLLGFSIFCFFSLKSPDSFLLKEQASLNVPFAGQLPLLELLIIGPFILITSRIFLHLYLKHLLKLNQAITETGVIRPPTLSLLNHPFIGLLMGLFLYLMIPLLMELFTLIAMAFPHYGRNMATVSIIVSIWHLVLLFQNPQKLIPWALLQWALCILLFLYMISFFLVLVYPDKFRRSLDLSYSDLSGQWIGEKDLQHAYLSNANFKEAYLGDSNLQFASGKNTNFEGADLSGVNFKETNLDKSNFNRANLSGANFNGASVKFSKFNDADLSHTSFQKAILEEANFKNSTLYHTSLNQAKLLMSDFSQTKIYWSNLNDSYLDLANFNKANIENTCIQNASLVQVSFRDTEFIGDNLEQADFRKADLSQTLISNVNLIEANLQGVNFQQAEISHTSFKWAKLSGANFGKVLFHGVNFDRADFHEVSLEGAEFEIFDSTIVFEGKPLESLKSFSWSATFRGVDLRKIHGLTQNQLDKVCGDEETKFPEGLTIRTCPPGFGIHMPNRVICEETGPRYNIGFDF